jgi:hypothetical protein
MGQYQGECLCGGCCYVVTGLPTAMYLCHCSRCSRCRKETGSAYASTVFFHVAHLAWANGESNVGMF